MQDENNQNNQQDRDAVFMELINSMRRDFPTSQIAKMSDESAMETAASWSGHLKHVPAERIMGLYSAFAIGSKFPPTMSDIVNLWSETYFQETQQRRDAKRHREDEELKKLNAEKKKPLGYTVFEMMGKRHAVGKDAVCCKCEDANGDAQAAMISQDGEWFKCQTHSCDFLWRVDDFMNAPVATSFRGASGAFTGLTKTTPQTAFNPPESAAPAQLTDEEVLSELIERCGLKFEEKQREYWLKFARWMEGKIQIDVWTATVARSMYERFKVEATRVAA